MGNRREEVAPGLLGLHHPVAFVFQADGGGMPLESHRQHVGGSLERPPVILRNLVLPVQVVERDAAPRLPLAVHDDDLKQLCGTGRRKRRKGLSPRIGKLDDVVGVFDGWNLELVERARLAAFWALFRHSPGMEQAVVAIDGMDRDVVACGQVEQAVQQEVGQSRQVVLRERVGKKFGAKPLVFLHPYDRLHAARPVIRDGQKLQRGTEAMRDLVHVMRVRLRIVGHHPPPAIAFLELRDGGGRHRAVGRPVHVRQGFALPKDHRLFPREEVLRQPLPEVDGRLRAVVAAVRRILAEPVAARTVVGAQHEMLRPGDGTHLGAKEFPELLVVLVLEHELHDLGLEAGDVQRDGQVVIGCDAFQGRHDDECRTPQKAGLNRRERTLLGKPDAQDADKPSLLENAGGMEDLYLPCKAGHGTFRLDVLPQPGDLVFAERDDGTSQEPHVEGAQGLWADDQVPYVRHAVSRQHMARKNRSAAVRAYVLHDVAEVGIQAFAHDLQHLRRAHGVHVILERGQRAVQIAVVFLALVLLPHDVQTGHVLLVQPLAVEEKGGRLVDVEDDAVGEFLAGRLDEIKTRKSADRVVGPHQRRRDQGLDALRRQPVARAGIDGVDVREQEVAPRRDAGVKFDEVGEIARLLAADLGLDALGAPLVRVGAHGRLAGVPEPIDVAAVRAYVPADRGKHESGRILVGRCLDDMPQKRTEQHAVVAQNFDG